MDPNNPSLKNLAGLPEDQAKNLIDWLRTDDYLKRESNDYLLTSLDNRPAQDRQAILEWLHLESDEFPLKPTEFERVFIAQINDESTKVEALAWLTQARTILSSDSLSIGQKVAKLMATSLAENTLPIFQAVGEVVFSSYQKLPMALRVALPVTLLAAPFLGGTSVGVAAFGGAIGLPALLVLLLGVSGITAIITSLLNTQDEEALFLQGILAIIATDAALTRMSKQAREAIVKEIKVPVKQTISNDREVLQTSLLAMDPIAFERHVMSFFLDAGMTAWVTPIGNDAGIDGVAKDGDRLILVQCKRYSPDHAVGRPAIQEFKGTIEENQADLGVFVTTSSFTSQALDSAGKSNQLVLIDKELLLDWHVKGFSLERS